MATAALPLLHRPRHAGEAVATTTHGTGAAAATAAGGGAGGGGAERLRTVACAFLDSDDSAKTHDARALHANRSASTLPFDRAAHGGFRPTDGHLAPPLAFASVAAAPGMYGPRWPLPTAPAAAPAAAGRPAAARGRPSTMSVPPQRISEVPDNASTCFTSGFSSGFSGGFSGGFSRDALSSVALQNGAPRVSVPPMGAGGSAERPSGAKAPLFLYREPVLSQRFLSVLEWPGDQVQQGKWSAAVVYSRSQSVLPIAQYDGAWPARKLAPGAGPGPGSEKQFSIPPLAAPVPAPSGGFASSPLSVWRYSGTPSPTAGAAALPPAPAVKSRRLAASVAPPRPPWAIASATASAAASAGGSDRKASFPVLERSLYTVREKKSAEKSGGAKKKTKRREGAAQPPAATAAQPAELAAAQPALAAFPPGPLPAAPTTTPAAGLPPKPPAAVEAVFSVPARLHPELGNVSRAAPSGAPFQPSRDAPFGVAASAAATAAAPERGVASAVFDAFATTPGAGGDSRRLSAQGAPLFLRSPSGAGGRLTAGGAAGDVALGFAFRPQREAGLAYYRSTVGTVRGAAAPTRAPGAAAAARAPEVSAAAAVRTPAPPAPRDAPLWRFSSAAAAPAAPPGPGGIARRRRREGPPTPPAPSPRGLRVPSPGHSGLANAAGANNCYLNVILQSLWHLTFFRQELMLGAGAASGGGAGGGAAGGGAAGAGGAGGGGAGGAVSAAAGGAAAGGVAGSGSAAGAAESAVGGKKVAAFAAAAGGAGGSAATAASAASAAAPLTTALRSLFERFAFDGTRVFEPAEVKRALNLPGSREDADEILDAFLMQLHEEGAAPVAAPSGGGGGCRCVAHEVFCVQSTGGIYSRLIQRVYVADLVGQPPLPAAAATLPAAATAAAGEPASPCKASSPQAAAPPKPANVLAAVWDREAKEFSGGRPEKAVRSGRWRLPPVLICALVWPARAASRDLIETALKVFVTQSVVFKFRRGAERPTLGAAGPEAAVPSGERESVGTPASVAYDLRGIILFACQGHYVVLLRDAARWTLCDDASVRDVGGADDFATVAHMCTSRRMLPALFFFEKRA